MIFISAGHHFNPQGADPGAMATHDGKLYKEAELTRELRDLVTTELTRLGAPFITDRDYETLQQYIARIKPGSGSVLCELHFNAAPAATATGVEVIVKKEPELEERGLGIELCSAIVSEMRIFNRGVKTEDKSHRGRLAILHTAAGISILPEICFITNPRDMMSYETAKHAIAIHIAALLVKYDKYR